MFSESLFVSVHLLAALDMKVQAAPERIKNPTLESPLSTADAMRDIQILFRKSPNGRFFISFQTHILTAKIK